MDDGRHEGEGPPDGAGFDPAQVDQSGSDEAENASEELQKHKHRRVTTEPVPGSDPTPQSEPQRHSGDENDARLKADKPPHWG